MKTENIVAAFLLLASLTGCVMPRLGDMSGAPLATPGDLKLVLRCDYDGQSLDLVLKNSSNHPVAENYPGPCTVWIVREGSEPLALFSPCAMIHPNPLPILEPQEEYRFSLSATNSFILMQPVNLKDGMVFVEYSMGDRSIYSPVVQITNDFVVETQWTTNKSTVRLRRP
jgi:hypothetical protein